MPNLMLMAAPLARKLLVSIEEELIVLEVTWRWTSTLRPSRRSKEIFRKFFPSLSVTKASSDSGAADG